MPVAIRICHNVNLVQEKSAEMELDDAVEEAVSQCIKDGILADFLLKIAITECNQDLIDKLRRE